MACNNSVEFFEQLKRAASFLMFLAITSCAVNPVNESTWSTDLPPMAYFISQFHRDGVNKKIENLGEYLTWINRFYQGWELYPNGWNAITQDVLLKQKDPKTEATIKTKMDSLGLVISGEWAKNNRTRLINTRHVSIWGNALLKSLDVGDTLALIDRVSQDINDLLARKIAAEAITSDRYYAQEEDIAF